MYWEVVQCVIKANAAGAPYNVTGKNGKPPSNMKCTPLLTPIWSESIVAWDKESRILTRGRKVKSGVVNIK